MPRSLMPVPIATAPEHVPHCRPAAFPLDLNARRERGIGRIQRERVGIYLLSDFGGQLAEEGGLLLVVLVVLIVHRPNALLCN